MDKLIPRRLHGVADYTYVALVARAPELAHFTEEQVAAGLCRLLSGGAFAYSVVTRYEWDVYRVLPYKTHLNLDFLSGLFALGAPYLFGFSRNANARNTFLAMGVVSLLASTLSKPDEM